MGEKVIPKSKSKSIKILLSLILIEGIIALFFLAESGSMEKNTWLLGYSKSMIGLLIIIVVLLVALGLFLWKFIKKTDFQTKVLNWIDKIFRRKFFLLDWTIWNIIFIIIGLIMVVTIDSIQNTMASLLSVQFDYLISIYKGVILRSLPILIWLILSSIQVQLFLIFEFEHIYREESFFSIWRVFQIITIVLMIGFTIFQWLILVFQLRFFHSLPYWFWKFYDKPLKHSWFLIIIYLVVIFISVLVLRKKKNYWIAVLLLIGLGAFIQFGLAFAEGSGIATLQQNFILKGHFRYPIFVSMETPGFWETIRNYEIVAQYDNFFNTKPPGVIGLYILFQKALEIIWPANSFEVRYSHMTLMMAYIAPLISMITVWLLTIISKKIFSNSDPFLPGLLYLTIPAVVLTPLFLDQFLYPILTMVLLICSVQTMQKKSITWALMGGILSYISIFISFSLLPIIFLSALWMLLLYLQNLGEFDLKMMGKLAGGWIAGFLILFLIFYIVSDYDIITRYSTAMAGHKWHKEYQSGFQQIKDAFILNNAEFSSWIGFPLVLLFILQIFRTLIAFIKKKSTSLDSFLLAFLIMFTILNVSGQTRSEVARLWIFIMPIIAIFSSVELDKLFRKRQKGILLIISLQIITTFALFKFQDLD
ncbi:MAG: hypothetical protein JEZ06_08610 [Anaerolineaceae bacterium]|nr:hypothetical protein [Anaerolineaceae bacterium]